VAQIQGYLAIDWLVLVDPGVGALLSALAKRDFGRRGPPHLRGRSRLGEGGLRAHGAVDPEKATVGVLQEPRLLAALHLSPQPPVCRDQHMSAVGESEHPEGLVPLELVEAVQSTDVAAGEGRNEASRGAVERPKDSAIERYQPSDDRLGVGPIDVDRTEE
jgi:hypothetical protein